MFPSTSPPIATIITLYIRSAEVADHETAADPCDLILTINILGALGSYSRAPIYRINVRLHFFRELILHLVYFYEVSALHSRLGHSLEICLLWNDPTIILRPFWALFASPYGTWEASKHTHNIRIWCMNLITHLNNILNPEISVFNCI